MTRTALMTAIAVTVLSLGLGLSASACSSGPDLEGFLEPFLEYSPGFDPYDPSSIVECLEYLLAHPTPPLLLIRPECSGHPWNPWWLPFPVWDVDMDAVRTEAQSDHPVCPRCGSERVVPIVYGYPGERLLAMAQAGQVELGGCIVSGNDPDLRCKTCGFAWKDQFGPAEIGGGGPSLIEQWQGLLGRW